MEHISIYSFISSHANASCSAASWGQRK